MNFGFWVLFVFCYLGFGFSPAALCQHPSSVIGRPSSYGFELIRDHDAKIIIFRIDSLSDAYGKGIRPGMELIGWNTLPIERKLAKMKVKKYRKSYPGYSDEQIRFHLLVQGKPSESAELFFMTEAGNNWGVKIVASCRLPVTG